MNSFPFLSTITVPYQPNFLTQLKQKCKIQAEPYASVSKATPNCLLCKVGLILFPCPEQVQIQNSLVLMQLLGLDQPWHICYQATTEQQGQQSQTLPMRSDQQQLAPTWAILHSLPVCPKQDHHCGSPTCWKPAGARSSCFVWKQHCQQAPSCPGNNSLLLGLADAPDLAISI